MVLQRTWNKSPVGLGGSFDRGGVWGGGQQLDPDASVEINTEDLVHIGEEHKVSNVNTMRINHMFLLRIAMCQTFTGEKAIIGSNWSTESLLCTLGESEHYCNNSLGIVFCSFDSYIPNLGMFHFSSNFVAQLLSNQRWGAPARPWNSCGYLLNPMYHKH